MRSVRAVGVLLLAIPALVVASAGLFPGYDARSTGFAQSFGTIVDAGAEYLLALVLIFTTGVALAGLARVLAVTGRL